MFTYLTEINRTKQENNDLLTTGTTTLVFIDSLKNKPTKAPQILQDKIYPGFN